MYAQQMVNYVITAWITNHIHHKGWDEIIYPFPNFNGAIHVWESISDFIHTLLGMW